MWTSIYKGTRYPIKWTFLSCMSYKSSTLNTSLLTCVWCSLGSVKCFFLHLPSTRKPLFTTKSALLSCLIKCYFKLGFSSRICIVAANTLLLWSSPLLPVCPVAKRVQEYEHEQDIIIAHLSTYFFFFFLSGVGTTCSRLIPLISGPQSTNTSSCWWLCCD